MLPEAKDALFIGLVIVTEGIVVSVLGLVVADISDDRGPILPALSTAETL